MVINFQVKKKNSAPPATVLKTFYELFCTHKLLVLTGTDTKFHLCCHTREMNALFSLDSTVVFYDVIALRLFISLLIGYRPLIIIHEVRNNHRHRKCEA